MFEDIINCGKTCSEDCDCGGDCDMESECPLCGSDNIGTSASQVGIQLYCADCGHTWFM